MDDFSFRGVVPGFAFREKALRSERMVLYFILQKK